MSNDFESVCVSGGSASYFRTLCLAQVVMMERTKVIAMNFQEEVADGGRRGQPVDPQQIIHRFSLVPLRISHKTLSLMPTEGPLSKAD